MAKDLSGFLSRGDACEDLLRREPIAPSPKPTSTRRNLRPRSRFGRWLAEPAGFAEPVGAGCESDGRPAGS
jgi:hypothetical protein